jgi:hypothetical protein
MFERMVAHQGETLEMTVNILNGTVAALAAMVIMLFVLTVIVSTIPYGG